MKSKTDELTEKAFYHAMNFFKHNDRGVDNQRVCVQQLMGITGFDFDTCLKIQNPVLSLYMARDTMGIGQDIIENNLQMVTQTIRNHLSDLQINYSQNSQEPISSSFKKIAPHDYSGASKEDIDKHFVMAYDNGNKRLDINGFLEKGNVAVSRTVEHLDYLAKSKGKYVLSEKKHLNFSFNLMNDDSVSYLAKFLHGQELNLTQFNLGYNIISDKGIEPLFYNLRNDFNVSIHQIQIINLSNNNIGDYGSHYISQSLISGRYPNLRCLDVSGNNLSYGMCVEFSKFIQNIGQNIKILANRLFSLDTIINGGKKQSDLFYGSKEEKQKIIKDYLKKAQNNGVDIQNVAVSKDVFTSIINKVKSGGSLLFGITKCKIVPKNFTTFAEDKIVAHVSPFISGIKTVTDVTACYFEAFDKTAYSQEGIQFMMDIGLVGQDEFLENIE